ncbi:MAG: SEC-C metal-binding domain-containing protein [Gammaproteobacteria bacterium]
MIKYNASEFSKVEGHFPNLYFVKSENAIKGELDFHARYVQNKGVEILDEWIIEDFDQPQEGCLTDVYSIRIELQTPDLVNKQYPAVFEPDGRIQNLAKSLDKTLADMHISEDGLCCLGIFAPTDELLLCDFVLHRVFPYFVWQSYYEKYGTAHPCKACPHDPVAAIQVRIEDEDRKIDTLRSKQNAGHRGADRNKPCPCGSGKKYKRCCFNVDHDATTRIMRAERRVDYFEKAKKSQEKNKHSKCLK